MLRRKLAENLVSAENESKRNRLLIENKQFADEKLALVLKNICYESWTSEPTKAQKTAQAIKNLLKFNQNLYSLHFGLRFHFFTLKSVNNDTLS